jgi:hypothetical protein
MRPLAINLQYGKCSVSEKKSLHSVFPHSYSSFKHSKYDIHTTYYSKEKILYVDLITSVLKFKLKASCLLGSCLVTWYHKCTPLCSPCWLKWGLLNFFWGWCQTVILPTSTSQVVGIRPVSYCTQWEKNMLYWNL